MKLPPDLEAKILELAGVKPTPAAAKVDPPALVAARYTAPGTWVVPLATAVEVNDRNWRARSARTHAARRAVSRVLGPHLRALAPLAEHYHRGGALRVTLTRLGGRKCDRSNLPTALKAVEDALAMTLGADDGDARWRASFEQEPGGLVGVQITLEVA